MDVVNQANNQIDKKEIMPNQEKWFSSLPSVWEMRSLLLIF